MSDTESLGSIVESLRSNAPAPADSKPETQTTPEAEPAKEPAAEAGQPRDPHGRFAPKAETQPETPTAEAAPAPVAETPPPAPQKPLIDPEQFKGYLDEKEKRKAIQAERDKLAAELKALREQQSAQPVPNPLDDPDGYATHMEEKWQRALLVQHLNNSEMRVRDSGKYTPEEIDAAQQWGVQRATSDEGFRQRLISQPHPVEWNIREYKRDQLLSQVGDDPDAWVLKRAAELAAAQGQQPPQPSPAASPQPAQAATPPPTRSLASATSAGGLSAVIDPGEVPLKQIFGR